MGYWEQNYFSCLCEIFVQSREAKWANQQKIDTPTFWQISEGKWDIGSTTRSWIFERTHAKFYMDLKSESNEHLRAVKFHYLLDTLHNLRNAKKHQFGVCPQCYKTWIFCMQMAWCKIIHILKLKRNMHELIIYLCKWNIPSGFFG